MAGPVGPTVNEASSLSTGNVASPWRVPLTCPIWAIRLRSRAMSPASRPQVSELTGGRGPFVAGTFFDLTTVGYEQAEYVVSGTARAYERTDSGVRAAEEAGYRTRIVVYRPSDAAAFNGSVIVEWLNVSAGLDSAPLWLFTHRELIRSGAAWVGLSAQRVGIHGGDSALGMVEGMALQETDPERYGSLEHPGDRFSYDLLTAAGEVARAGTGTVLEGLPVDRVLAMGESQSAFRLTTYINDIDPLTPVFDGFLVHARGGTGGPLHDDGDPRQLTAGAPTPFRDDLRVPVLCVQAETDLITLGYLAARQDDAERFVLWEMAGTSHADVYTFAVGFSDDGLRPIEQLAASWRPVRELLGSQLDEAVNVGPQHYIVNAAVRALDAWVRDGVRPPAAPRLELEGYGFATDELGNALGGIRTPHVDVPVAVLSGLGNGGSPMAFLTGSTIPFTNGRLVDLYGTRDAFVERFRDSADATVRAGFFLSDDLDEIVAIAAANVDL